MGKLLLICLAGASLPRIGQAHDPFDHSSRLTVFGDRMELVVTLGQDIAEPYFKATKTRVSSGPSPFTELPPAAADRMVELRTGAERLHPGRMSGYQGPTEVIFTIIYPRPPPGPLDVRMLFFDLLPDLREGSFAANDDFLNRLGTALLSPKNPSIQITIPSIQAAQLPEPAGTAAPLPAQYPLPAQAPSTTAPPAPKPSLVPRPTFAEFFRLGVEHILTGFDHLLFLAALLIGVRRLRPMLVIITCFTLAHSITLALATIGLVQVSPRLIEPVIALSIIIVGLENLLRSDAPADRYWLAGGFGLIHGFGFATVLRETGLGQAGSSIAIPLFSFNLGVEAGQLAVAALIAPLFLLLRQKPALARFTVPALSCVVIVLSGYWFVERAVLGR